MKFFLEILVLALCALIVIFKGEKRTTIYLISTFFIPDTFGTAHIILPLSYIISMYIRKELSEQIKQFPLRKISIAILIIYFLISIFDDRLSVIETFTRPIIYFIKTYLFLFVGFCLINNNRQRIYAFKVLLIILSIYAIYGIFTWIISRNPWYDGVAKIYLSGEGIWADVQERGYRVNSFLSNPIAYGLIMGIGSLSLWLFCKEHSKKINTIFLGIIIFNVLLSNSRTSIIAFGIGIILFLVLYLGISLKMISTFILFYIILFTLYINVESIQSMINPVIDIFITGGNNTQGSNVELKNDQLATSLLYFYDSPFLGHGINYFRENIQERYGMLSGLAGLEGYGYRILVELGVFMLIAFIIYIINFIRITVSYYKQNKMIASILISQFIAFIFFIIATGDYGGVFEYAFIIIGVNLKWLISSQNVSIIKYKNKTNDNKRFLSRF